MLDDTGYADLGAYVSEIKTPNIDRPAPEGVRFSNFHAAAMTLSKLCLMLAGGGLVLIRALSRHNALLADRCLQVGMSAARHSLRCVP